jgi:hypothetical protein
MSNRNGTAEVSYEPSYIHFETDGKPASPTTNTGRKVFGTFVPNIDVPKILVVSASDKLGPHQKRQ